MLAALTGKKDDGEEGMAFQSPTEGEETNTRRLVRKTKVEVRCTRQAKE